MYHRRKTWNFWPLYNVYTVLFLYLDLQMRYMATLDRLSNKSPAFNVVNYL